MHETAPSTDPPAAPAVPVSAGRPDQTALAQVFADPHCFSFQERFPGGFTPQFGGDVLDASLVVGLRGQLAGHILWDASASAGSSEADFFIYDTVNASLGPATPTMFDPGLYRQDEIGLNVDLGFPVNDRVHLAGGAEWRDERFTIGLGDEPSWQIGPYAPQGFSAGSNGFPGFSPIAAGAWSRANTALYGDIEVRGRDDGWSLGGALRLEDFEDFGTTTNGRLSGRLRLAAGAALRASASSGFRAPTPGQQNAFNVSTEYDHELMDLVNNGTIPSTSRVAGLRGGEPLQPERSISTTLGAVVDAGAFNLYDEWFDSRDLYVYHGDAVVDLEAAYAISESTTLTIGGQNAFGNDPEENPIARAKGNRFSVQTPFGANGAFFYVRINYGWASGG
ncbi:MAG: TonB-dependent receptor [Acidobacteria bacterium]|nr:TonB-dependent receptor [Acidobacteriota bacterium]